MEQARLNTASRDFQTLFEVGALGGLTDGQLLDRFVSKREEAIFEAIVCRHGPMVWGVCRRVLRDYHDAEDAFQATFLVLARRASSVSTREKIGNWLYGVAYRTSMKARAIRARRRGRENQGLEMPEPESIAARPDERLSLLDRELSRLPEKFRIPIILCELEGKTHREVAEQLGWPIGTVSGRLARAKAMLARRVSRGGVPLSVGSLTVLLARDAASATMPTKLIGPTSVAASLFVAGRAMQSGLVSAEVFSLVGGVMKTMLLPKLKIVSVVLLATALIAVGIWQVGSRADERAPLDAEVFHATVNDLIGEGSLIVIQVVVETLPGSWVQVVPDRPDQGGGGVLASSADLARRKGPVRNQVTILADHAEWKAGSVNSLKFVMKFGGPSSSSSMSITGPMPEGKSLADVVAVALKPGDYRYGEAIKLVKFQDVTYSLVVKKPD